MLFPYKVRVYAPPGNYPYLDYALHVAAELLTFYGELFGEPFTLPKLGTLVVNKVNII